MNLFRKLFDGSSKKDVSTANAKPIESILMVEDAALYAVIRDASVAQRRRVSLAVARYAVARMEIWDAVLEDAFACLESGRQPGEEMVSAVNQLAVDLDEENWRLEEAAEEAKETFSGSAAFHQARAVSSVEAALSGRTDEAVYEAIHATEDLPKVREMVLEELKSA